MNLKVTRGVRYEYTDEDTGKKYFSVSQVLNVLDPDAFRDIGYEVLEGAQYRGRRVHTLFSRVLAWKAGLSPAVPWCDEAYKGYLDSIVALVEQERILPILIEKKDVDPKLPIAGTFDAKLSWGHQQGITLCDLKTGTQKRRAHRVQLQLYRRFPSCIDVKQMCTIYAQKDGAPAMVEWVKASAEDWAWAQNGLNVLIGRNYG